MGKLSVALWETLQLPLINVPVPIHKILLGGGVAIKSCWGGGGGCKWQSYSGIHVEL